MTVFTELMRKFWDNYQKKKNDLVVNLMIDDAKDEKFQAFEKNQFSQLTIHSS